MEDGKEMYRSSNACVWLTINMILFDFSYFPHSPIVVYRAVIPINEEEKEHKQKTGRKR